ncbi:hypothetical protein PIB30_090774 [Stylosanthes scabra]|uniref:Uncharacterized protein n=1 Tax=Stylosanthes scabra TaxID=79078 RepID=A0ABU6ZT65_9FABA|nr:hypothetical protein [Stylosanthes scabra]
MIDASSGGALMNKTPEETWELIETMADNNQHFKTRATTVTKGIFEVAPSESAGLANSPILPSKCQPNIAAYARVTPITPMNVHNFKKITLLQPFTIFMKHHHPKINHIRHNLKGSGITNQTDGTPLNNSNQLNTANQPQNSQNQRYKPLHTRQTYPTNFPINTLVEE